MGLRPPLRRSAADLPIFEAWSLLAAVAAVTERAQLGTLVTPPFFRNPAVLAKQIATIDHISNGRTIAGLGAGWFEAEFEGYGCSFPPLRERMRALEETVQILKRLWTEETTSFAGRHFSVKDAICEPKPVRRPPILIGGGGETRADGHRRPPRRHLEQPGRVPAAARRQDRGAAAALRRGRARLRHARDLAAVRGGDRRRRCDAARASLEKAKKIYGGHMGASLEEHGIWGAPDG